MHKYIEYGYHAKAPGIGATNGPIAELIVQVVNQLPEVKSICELGCGNGFLINKLSSLDCDLFGIDASESGISLAKENYENAVFLCELIDRDLPAKINKKFDLIVSSDVVEHLYRPSDLVIVANELLKKDGCLLIGTPYHGYLKNLALSLLSKWDSHHGVDWDGGHIKFFSVKTLSKLLEVNGFQIQRFYFYGRAPWLWKNMLCLARKVD